MRDFKVLEGNQRRDQRLSFIMGPEQVIGRKSSSEINHFWLRELISWDLYPRERDSKMWVLVEDY